MGTNKLLLSPFNTISRLLCGRHASCGFADKVNALKLMKIWYNYNINAI
jgi:hypothetical protein